MSQVTFIVLNSGKVFFQGVELEIPYVADLKKKYKTVLKVHYRRAEMVTRSKALGAQEDGIDTLVDVSFNVDYSEIEIDLPLEVEAELMEKVMKLKGDDDFPALDKREARV